MAPARPWSLDQPEDPDHAYSRRVEVVYANALAAILVAMRLFIEEMGLALSTREPSKLRDALIPLGVTQMSAGSSTRPGGYSGGDSLGDQFEVVDLRSPSQVARVLQDRGYDPVWKDWDEGFGHGGTG